MVYAVFTGWSTVLALILLGLALYLPSISVSSFFVVLYLKLFVTFFTLPFSELSLVGLPLTWLTMVNVLFQCYDTVGVAVIKDRLNE